MLQAEGITRVLDEAGHDGVEAVMAQGFTFPQAIEVLASHLGISLALQRPSRVPDGEIQGQRRLLGIVEIATNYYEWYLWHGQDAIAEVARTYLGNRHIDEATARLFRLGAAPGDNSLSHHFAAQGVPSSHLMLSGLGYDGGGDVFKQRLVLPVRRPDGLVNGFGARVMLADDPTAKYINSPTTLIFDKGHALYTPPGLRRACIAAKYVILVEGYLDVIAMYQHGFTNVCSIMGVAATDGQVARLASMAPTVVVGLDPDVAGERASVSAAKALVKIGADVRMAAFRGGDPDELLRAEGGVDYVRRALETVTPFEWVDSHPSDDVQ